MTERSIRTIDSQVMTGRAGRLRLTSKNPYVPRSAIIREITRETDSVSTFVMSFIDELENNSFSYQPGQFMMVSVAHQGEAPISISSSSLQSDFFSLTIRNSGRLTKAMHSLKPGNVIGLRGPYGTAFPLEEMQGRNLLIVGGGIGMAPLRSVVHTCCRQPDHFGKVSVLYGSQNPGELCFQSEMQSWKEAGVDCRLIVDAADNGWQHQVGLVTDLLTDEFRPQKKKDLALVCGPGIMIRFVIQRLEELGYSPENIFTTLERHMKCGFGLCGHCHCREKLVCVDGPVFRRSQLGVLEDL
ncbi:MAG: FAD/NAD(P)-binding protein [Desulfobulbaceae bacterium]|uniref:FAD/NAD(P)-binding protein n=1 Tax=Candidatus Desulfatifera sulfidica TaxID=2841691 RepID=A0A8J6TD25_9BACT|nr:FAD/NAD(P)-binding protein [Candidatus Desulfatifera sulfidica]